MSYSIFGILFIVIPFIVYVAFAALVLFNNVRIGKKLVENSPAFSREGTFATRVLVVGDSLAVGVGAYGIQTIPERLAFMLDAAVENRAQSGARMKDIEAQITQSTNQRYDYILILGGANDIIQRTPDGDLKVAIQAVYGAARLKSDKVIALTSGDIGAAPFFVFPLNLYFTKRTTETRPFFVDTAKGLGVEYINLLEYPLVFNTDAPRYYAEDLLHLSADGYGVWYKYIKERLEKVWNEKDRTPLEKLEREKSAFGEKEQLETVPQK